MIYDLLNSAIADDLDDLEWPSELFIYC